MRIDAPATFGATTHALRQLGGTYQSEVVRRAEVDEARLAITGDEWAVDTGPVEGVQLEQDKSPAISFAGGF